MNKQVIVPFETGQKTGQRFFRRMIEGIGHFQYRGMTIGSGDVKLAVWGINGLNGIIYWRLVGGGRKEGINFGAFVIGI